MKKLLMAATVLALSSSCTYYDKLVKFNLNFEDKKSDVGNNKGLDLAVHDDRLKPSFIGTKEFCDNKKININTEQNLAELLKKKIDENLSQKGFKKGNDRLVEIHLEQLQYKAECGFLLGKSKADVVIRVAVTNPLLNTTMTKTFELSSNNKHFIIPLSATDEKIINDVLEEVVQDILNHDMLVR